MYCEQHKVAMQTSIYRTVRDVALIRSRCPVCRELEYVGCIVDFFKDAKEPK